MTSQVVTKGGGGKRGKVDVPSSRDGLPHRASERKYDNINQNDRLTLALHHGQATPRGILSPKLRLPDRWISRTLRSIFKGQPQELHEMTGTQGWVICHPYLSK